MTVLNGGWDKHFIQLCSSNFTEKRKIAYCIRAVREVDMSTASFLSYHVVQKTNRKKRVETSGKDLVQKTSNRNARLNYIHATVSRPNTQETSQRTKVSFNSRFCAF